MDIISFLMSSWFCKASRRLLTSSPTFSKRRMASAKSAGYSSSRSNASISVLEYVCLIMLMKRAGATSVFEFGTYKGVSITQLALNLPDGARIFTLDLPDGQASSELPISIPKDVSIAFEAGKGDLVPADVRERIRFLRQDSAKFDPDPYAGQMDFVFVDGAHNTEYVRNDSEKGWKMLRPGGIIVWHDCAPNDPEVVRYLLTSDFKPARIQSTSLAYAVKRSVKTGA